MASSNTYKLPKAQSTISVTIPNDGVPHQILPLMQAVDPQTATKGKYLCIQNDPLLSTASCYLGEGPTDDQGLANPAVVSATNHLVIQAGSSETFGGFWDEYNSVSRYWAINSGEGTGVLKLNMQITRG